MLTRSLLKGFDKKRLRNLLIIFFLSMAIPTAILIWQTYSQLRWEAFHQQRGRAEELTRRIDARLIELINAADARSFADYTFLVVTGEPSANFLQRSPLSEFPVTAQLPGVLGYFQVDPDGTFSTPLLPPASTEIGKLGISSGEYQQRLQLARSLQTILSDNRLVESRAPAGLRRGIAAMTVSPEPAPAKVTFEEEKVNKPEPGVLGSFGDEISIDKDKSESFASIPLEQATSKNATYNQQVFDQLSAGGGTLELDDKLGEAVAAKKRLNTVGKVADLKLDAALQKKSEDIERARSQELYNENGRADAPARAKRREQIVLPVSTTAAAPLDRQRAFALSTASELRISTFESEIDPLEFSLLDSGHFVLFRKVWRNGQRYIQGLLIDQGTFISDAVTSSFMETALSTLSTLTIAHQDDVLRSFSGREQRSRDYADPGLQSSLLYQSRLSAPLSSLELIYSINRLPPGPGARVLVWVTLVLAIVFVGGFYALYRLGLSQINLARQQQDFISAVSHELKTPLTSIRMYGEMLKEGWADEEKRQSYYEYIHDEAERLTRLISNVLQLARITRNEPQFDSRPMIVGELMSLIESKISNQVKNAGFELIFLGNEQIDTAKIDIDADSFTQIIINLVDNAIKFSKDAEQKYIEISAKLTNDKRVEFAVRDFGPGIPNNQIKKIFTLFYRSESELTRETVGTGIGLAIVHQLAVAMDGKVDVMNREPGAQFKISFPQHPEKEN